MKKTIFDTEPIDPTVLPVLANLAPVTRIGLFGVLAHDVSHLAQAGDAEALRKLALVAVQLTKAMDELIADNDTRNRVLEAWQPIFEQLPHAPVLKRRHGDGKAIEQRLEALRVGEKVISKEAKFNPDTPINRYVQTCLDHVREVQQYVHRCLNGAPTTTETLEQVLQHCANSGWFPADEIPIHRAVHKLPALTKSPDVSTGSRSLADQ